MNDFNNLIVRTRCKILLTHGEQPSFSIDENGEKANWINIAIVNNQLVVYTKPEYYGYLLLHDYYPQITITYKTLMGLQMLDKCFVRSSNALTLQQMGIMIREGHLDMTVDAFLIDCTVLKSAYAKLSGETMISRILAYHKGIYDGSELEASEGKVHVHNEAIVSGWYTEELELGLFGRSKVEYRGNPRLKLVRVDERCTLKQINIADKVENKM